MSEFYCYEGIRNGATFVVDDTTKATIQSKPFDIVGKVVTITGDGKAGYGTAGATPLGFVEQVEKENTNSDDFVISVVWHQIKEGVPVDGSVTAGDNLACDGTGKVKTNSDFTGAKCIAAGDGSCIVKID